MLTTIGAVARRWEFSPPWTNVYGLARSLLAIGTTGTLLFSSNASLFRSIPGVPEAPLCVGPLRASLFCIVPGGSLWIGRWLAIAVLMVVATGWRPRYTALPHWWISFSVSVSIATPDGGDQVTQILTLLLLPIALTDGRRWHWQQPQTISQLSPSAEVARLVAMSAVWAVRLQMAGIYLNSSIAKLGVREWADGTALYYWTTHPAFGVPSWLQGLVMPVVSNPLGVVALTWGTLAVEFALAIGLFMPKTAWKYLLVLGISLHIGIAFLIGLPSFSLAMIAGLIVYLRPYEQRFSLAAFRRKLESGRVHILSILDGRLPEPMAS